MNDIPRELDWVQVRAGCTLAQMFKELQLGVEEDVRAVNLARQLSGDDQFQTDLLKGGFVAYCVLRPENVRFFLEADRIEIHNDLTHEKYALTISLTDEGRCKLVLNSAELEQWQVRRLALENLFFKP